MSSSEYYNTTNLSGEQLKQEYENARKQDGLVLNLFKEHKELTPCQAWSLLKTNSPITSIRRSINTLTKQGHLEKMAHQRIGIYGKHVHTWKITINL